MTVEWSLALGLAVLVAVVAVGAGFGWSLWFVERRRARGAAAPADPPSESEAAEAVDPAELEHLRSDLMQARSELGATRIELDRMRSERGASSADTPDVRPADGAGPHAVVDGLLEMYDRVAIRQYQAESGTAKELTWVHDGLTELLARCDVVPIATDGEVDPLRHRVVAVLPAPDPDLADHVAETVQTGFLWRDELIRPAQVTAYVRDA